MSAVWTAVRAGLRANRRGTALLALLVAVVAALGMTALAGARRTSSAYDRFLAVVNAADAATATDDTQIVGLTPVDPDVIRALPYVEGVEVAPMVIPGVIVHAERAARGVEGIEFGEVAMIGASGIRYDRLRPVDGRLPQTSSEIAMGFEYARRAGARPGDRITLELYSSGDMQTLLQGGEEIGEPRRRDVTLSGTVAFPGAFPPDPQYQQLYAGPGLIESLAGDTAGFGFVKIDVARRADIARLNDDLSRSTGGSHLFVSSLQTSASTKRAIDLQANALRVFAVAAALVAALVVAQAVGRQLAADAAALPVYRALGMSRAQRFGALLAQTGVIATAGGMLGAGLAFALSPLTPVGVARIAEPSPGLSFDTIVLVPGAFVAAAIVVLLSLPRVWLLSAARPASSVASTGRSAIGAAVSRAGMPVPVMAGVRLALERSEGSVVRSSGWNALGGVALATMSLVATLSFGASMNHLAETPRLFGWNWSALAGHQYAGDAVPFLRKVLESDDRFAAFSGVNPLLRIGLHSHDGAIEASLHAYEQARGSVTPAVVAGRWPEDTDEIALGSAVMRSLGVGVGDVVTATSGDRSKEMEVVGRSVFPSTGDPNVGDLGNAAGMTMEAASELIDGASSSMFHVRLAVGVTPEEIAADHPEIAGLFDAEPTPPSDLASVSRLQRLPIMLAVALGALAVAMLVHALVSTARRRRRDLAVLKALGCVPSQIRSAVVVQSMTIAGLAVAIGIAAGVLVGRWAWTAFAGHLGFVPEARTGWLAVGLVLPIALVVAAAAAALPARRAARTLAADALRPAE